MERIGFVGLGTMGAAMAANLGRAGFEISVWNRSPGRAPELDELGASRAATPAAVAEASDVVVICVSDTPDVEAVLFGAEGLAAGARSGHADHRLLDDLSGRDPGLRRPPGPGGHRDGRRSGVGRQRGRPEGDANDLRRWRAGRRRAGQAHPCRARQDDHPCRPDRLRAGGQSGQPGDPRRDLPRGRRGDRARDEVRSRCRPGRRGAGRRGRPELGPCQSERADDRERLPARLQGRPPPEGSRDRSRPRP